MKPEMNGSSDVHVLEILDLRLQFYNELKEKLEKGGSKALIKFSYPLNGETIKLNGIVLYKIVKTSNPWGNKGVVVYKRLTETALKAIEGKRSGDKKGWVGCPLTARNYKALMRILLEVCSKATFVRGSKMKVKQERIIKPKKKRIN